jgi:site-specific DNA-adenine methylase
VSASLKAPFPWFGGKSRVAHLVWGAFGDTANYVEPFAGSLAVLLARPHAPRIETVNDLDCYIANFWRSVQYAPEEVARWADWPVNEIDLHARHRWLVAQAEFRERLRGDPEYFDARVAGWWVWGICQWIGGGWCAESNWNPEVKLAHGSLAEVATTRPNLQPQGVHKRSLRGDKTATENRRPQLSNSNGVHRNSPPGAATAQANKRPSLSRGARGVQRVRDLSNSANWAKRPSLGKGARGVQRTADFEQIPVLGGSRGAANRGVHATGLIKKLPLLSGGAGHGVGVHNRGVEYGPVYEWMFALAERLRRVRVCCGDWTRVLGRSSTELIGVTGILLDPPYLSDFRDPSLYGTESGDVAHAVREWCLANGKNKKLRIALCGYEGEHKMPADWQCVSWKAAGGYAAAAGNHENSHKERIWFSPHCARAEDQADLFGGAA